MFYVYVLQSLKDTRLYKGLSQDVAKRLKQHNRGENRSTKGFVLWKLVYQEEFETRVAAREREKFFKSGVGREFLQRTIESSKDATE